VHHHDTPQRLLQWPVVLLPNGTPCLDHGLHAAHAGLDARVSLTLLLKQQQQQQQQQQQRNQLIKAHACLDACIPVALPSTLAWMSGITTCNNVHTFHDAELHSALDPLSVQLAALAPCNTTHLL
jgi:hypothetical protein